MHQPRTRQVVSAKFALIVMAGTARSLASAESLDEAFSCLRNYSCTSIVSSTADGPLPRALWRCEQLVLLDLDGSSVTGSLPHEIGSLSSLEVLNLQGLTGITGSLPSTIEHLSALKYMWLSGTSITGSLPREIGSLGNLESLDLSYMIINGSLPPEIGSLRNLKSLDLTEAPITGSLPPGIGSLNSLEYLSLSSTSITGSLPPELFSLGNLETLSLAATSITGSIPPEIGSLGNLNALSLSGTTITGSIPPEIGSLGDLDALYLGGTTITGSLPLELFSLGNLQMLALDGASSITGSLPPEIVSLSSLEYLSLPSTRITGSLPPELGSLGDLWYVDLKSTSITGTLPLPWCERPMTCSVEPHHYTCASLCPQSDDGPCGLVEQTCVSTSSPSAKASRVWMPAVAAAGIALVMCLGGVLAFRRKNTSPRTPSGHTRIELFDPLLESEIAGDHDAPVSRLVDPMRLRTTDALVIGVDASDRVVIWSAGMTSLTGDHRAEASLDDLPFWSTDDARGLASFVGRCRARTDRTAVDERDEGFGKAVVRFRVPSTSALAAVEFRASALSSNQLVILDGTPVQAHLLSLLHRRAPAATLPASDDEGEMLPWLDEHKSEVSSLTAGSEYEHPPRERLFRPLDAHHASDSLGGAARPAPVARLKCSVCNVKYSAAREFNSLWQLEREQCPACGSSQFPTLDGVLEGGSELESEAGSSAPRRTLLEEGSRHATPMENELILEVSSGSLPIEISSEESLGECSLEISRINAPPSRAA